MKPYLRSILTAVFVASVVLVLTVRVVAPNLPPVVGRPDLSERRAIASEPGIRVVRLDNPDGVIWISSYAGSEVKGEAEIRAYASDAAAREGLPTYVAGLVQVKQQGEVLEIVTEPQGRPDPVDLVVLYRLSVPEGTDLDIHTNNGNVWAREGCGQVTVHGRNADIEVRAPRGCVDLESLNGRLRLVDAPQGGRLQTVNGNVYAYLQGGTLNATTTNGVMIVQVTGQDVAGCTLNSQNGGITVILPEDSGAHLDARTARGKVKCDAPVDTTRGVRLRGRLDGLIGDGRAQFTMETLNGNIWITGSAR